MSLSISSLPLIADMDSKYIDKCLSLGLLDILCTSMDRNVYEVNIQGGYCLCSMAADCSAENAKCVLSKVSFSKNRKKKYIHIDMWLFFCKNEVYNRFFIDDSAIKFSISVT